MSNLHLHGLNIHAKDSGFFVWQKIFQAKSLLGHNDSYQSYAIKFHISFEIALAILHISTHIGSFRDWIRHCKKSFKDFAPALSSRHPRLFLGKKIRSLMNFYNMVSLWGRQLSTLPNGLKPKMPCILKSFDSRSNSKTFLKLLESSVWALGEGVCQAHRTKGKKYDVSTNTLLRASARIRRLLFERQKYRLQL